MPRELETNELLTLFLECPFPSESVIGLCSISKDDHPADLISFMISWGFCCGSTQGREDGNVRYRQS